MAQLVPPSPRLPRPSGYGTARDLAAFDGELVNSLQRELSEHARRLNGALMADGSEPFTGSLTVNGAADFDGNVNIDGTLNVEGATTIDDTLNITGITTVNGQIAFPATANLSANANTLDDYEEGSWTPAVQFGGAASGLTYTSRVGIYTKIGDLVVAVCNVIINAKGASVGAATVTGLPFGVVGVVGNVTWNFWQAFAAMAGHPTGFTSATTCNLYTGGGAVTANTMTDANFANGCQFHIIMIYKTTT